MLRLFLLTVQEERVVEEEGVYSSFNFSKFGKN
jgi:hypothetical protein